MVWPGSNSASRGSSSRTRADAPLRRLASRLGRRPMNGLPLAPRSTSGNGGRALFSVPFGSISSEVAASPSGSPTARRACMIGSGSPSSLTARSGSAARSARSRRPAASIIRVGAKTLPPAGGSCSASAVIETRTASPMHHGSATESAHAVRDRPIRDPAPHAKSVPRASRKVKATGAMRTRSGYRRLTLRGGYCRRDRGVPNWDAPGPPAHPVGKLSCAALSRGQR